MPRLPQWLKQDLVAKRYGSITASLLKDAKLNTVCQSARCPNRGLCFEAKTATFMILGDVCTRTCGFCAVSSGSPTPVDSDEAVRIKEVVTKLKLRHVVITSVTRDDLADQGVGQFEEVVNVLSALEPAVTIEILTPDFQANEEILQRIARWPLTVFNHNIETVPRLYPGVRPQADYQRSLRVLSRVGSLSDTIITKSGIMVGLGEREEEVRVTLADMFEHGVQMVTIGQYLQPSPRHLPVEEYVTPETFKRYEEYAKGLGFKAVASAPLVRSSFLAESLLEGVY